MKKFDYSKSDIDIFYKTIYPLYTDEFLFGNDYKLFVELVQEKFILNSKQWQQLKEHWEQKEKILKIEEAKGKKITEKEYKNHESRKNFKK